MTKPYRARLMGVTNCFGENGLLGILSLAITIVFCAKSRLRSSSRCHGLRSETWDASYKYYVNRDVTNVRTWRTFGLTLAN